MAIFTLGLDLGQSRDYSAGVVAEKVKMPTGRTVGYGWDADGVARTGPELVDGWHVVHAQRWSLGTPYPQVVANVGAMLAEDGPIPDASLVIDATGVGRGVVDMFSDAYRKGACGRWWPTPITITGGQERHGTNVPKLELISTLQAALQQDRLKIAAGLPAGAQLQHELERFKLKVSQSGALKFEAEHERDHDDLITAACLAVWYRGRGVPRMLQHDGATVDIG